MYFSITDPQFWLFALLFIASIFFSWYLPGLLLLRHAKIQSALTNTLLAISVGMVLWGVQGYLFGYLGLRWLTYAYLAGVIVLSIHQRFSILKTSYAAYKELISESKLILLSVIFASAIQLVVIINSGLNTPTGVRFFFSNTVDGIMHLSYIQSLVTDFPPVEPGASGLMLKNYHYWGDLVTAELVRVWQLPTLHLFFQYLPVLLVLVSMLLAIQLVGFFKGSTLTKFLALFFLTFGADLSYIFSFILHRELFMDIPILDNGITFFFNMPQVFARLLLISTLIIIAEWTKSTKSNIFLQIALILVLASQFGFKVYYGIYSVLGLGFLSVYLFLSSIFQKNKSLVVTIINYKQLIVTWLLIIGLAAAIYLPVNKNSGGLFFSPFEWPKLLLSNEHLNFSYWWAYLYGSIDNPIKMFILYTIAVIITFAMIHGTRFIGLLPFPKTLKSVPKEFFVFVLPTNLLFLTVGMLFFQTSGGFNIYNFFLVPTFSLCIIAAFNLSLIQKPIIRYLLITLIILATVPRSVSQLALHINHYQKNTSTATFPHSEIELLEYIKKNTDKNAILQADPKNGQDYLTPYVSFFTNRNTYFSGALLLETHNQSVAEREEIVKQIFSDGTSAGAAAEIMKTNGIDYLVVMSYDYVEKFRTKLNGSNALRIVFENERGYVVTSK